LSGHRRDHGCREIDEGGNHTRWAAASGKRRSAVPRHREIDYRLAQSICKQLGVAPPKGTSVRKPMSRNVSPTRQI